MAQHISRISLLLADRGRRAWLLGFLSVVPLLVWWIGWYPGFVSSDTFDQLAQAEAFSFNNLHPAIHSLYLWLLGTVTGNVAFVTLFQVLAMAGLLALIGARLHRLGVPAALAVGTIWLVSVLPAVGQTTIAFWKDVPFTLALLWGFAELMGMAGDPSGFLRSGGGRYRLGAALGLVWVLRHNGFLTVALLVLVLVVAVPDRRRLLTTVVAPLIAVVGLVQVVVYAAIPLNPVTVEPSEVFISDVAASLRWEPDNFSAAELALLEDIAPLDVWTTAYDCTDSTPLAFNASFDIEGLRAHAAEFQSLALQTIVRDPDTVLGHRWCAANYLFVPDQPDNAYFHRPPFEIPSNDLGLVRDPVSWKAYEFTRSVFVWAEPDGRLWLTWRPALAVWAALGTYAALAARRKLRRLLIPGALWLAQLANVAATSPAQEFRFAFGVYVMALTSLPLLWFVFRPSDLAPASGRPKSR
ncbi:MAG: DUF6020 family protein [Acidimicrobiia bacterium]|nr:DUF6020 family protein [Acidimicrobiia bacterium]